MLFRSKIIKEVDPPHPCYDELRDLPKSLYVGSIVECSCGRRYIRREDQRDGMYWAAAGDQHYD